MSRFVVGRFPELSAYRAAYASIVDPPGPPCAMKSGSGARGVATAGRTMVASWILGPAGFECRSGTVTYPHSIPLPSDTGDSKVVQSTAVQAADFVRAAG